MAVFSGLSEKLNHIFKKLSQKGKLTELEIKGAMREIKVALLEADVNFKVVKDFINTVSEKAVGQDILKSLTPAQQVIKIVNEQLVSLMGSTSAKLNRANKGVTVIMMCGLQGAGKTTFCGKLALSLKKQNYSVLLSACDVYRPAAIKQLKVLGDSIAVEVFEEGTGDPVKIALNAKKYADKKSFDYLIIDTAGRLQIDDKLMDELKRIRAAVLPNEILLAVDSMTGQEAVNVAKTFDETISITGVVLTKLDGDTRGGAALSIKAVLDKPIKYSSVGEKLSDLELFDPSRMAGRILGMGDVLSLIEKAQSSMSEENIKKLEKSFKEQNFTLNDYLLQIDSMKNMGDMGDFLSMIPGMGNKVDLSKASVDEKKIAQMKAIIQSMTDKERERPEIIGGTRKKRIASGSGTKIQDVNILLKQFEQSKMLMKSLKGKKGKFPGMPF